MTNTEARQRRLKIQMIGTREEENQRTEQRVKTYFKKIFLKLKKKKTKQNWDYILQKQNMYLRISTENDQNDFIITKR